MAQSGLSETSAGLSAFRGEADIGEYQCMQSAGGFRLTARHQSSNSQTSHFVAMVWGVQLERLEDQWGNFPPNLRLSCWCSSLLMLP